MREVTLSHFEDEAAQAWGSEMSGQCDLPGKWWNIDLHPSLLTHLSVLMVTGPQLPFCLRSPFFSLVLSLGMSFMLVPILFKREWKSFANMEDFTLCLQKDSRDGI